MTELSHTLRLPKAPDREAIPAAELPAYDAVAGRQANLWAGAHTSSDAYFGALLTSPPMAAGIAAEGRLMREGQLRGSYTNAERELVDVVYSVDFGYNAILYLHLPDMLACGVRPEAIDALRRGDQDRLDAAERQLVDYVRATVSGTVDDEQYVGLEKRLGVRGALEYTLFAAFLMTTFRLWQALGVPDVADSEVVRLLTACLSGDASVSGRVADRIG